MLALYKPPLLQDSLSSVRRFKLSGLESASKEATTCKVAALRAFRQGCAATGTVKIRHVLRPL
jgi:hypothetical protein